MLIKTLENTITVLDKLLCVTLEDIENIKLAKHGEVFKNTKTNFSRGVRTTYLKKIKY